MKRAPVSRFLARLMANRDGYDEIDVCQMSQHENRWRGLAKLSNYFDLSISVSNACTASFDQVTATARRQVIPKLGTVFHRVELLP